MKKTRYIRAENQCASFQTEFLGLILRNAHALFKILLQKHGYHSSLDKDQLFFLNKTY